jgi:hypothetical protein
VAAVKASFGIVEVSPWVAVKASLVGGGDGAHLPHSPPPQFSSVGVESWM